jgi:arylsulfatase
MSKHATNRRRRASKLTCISLAVASLGLATNSYAKQDTPATDTQPNILLLLADDLGYSDIGAFGGEISTPNLDKLAAEGRLLLDHHTAFLSSPTRAMINSGTDQHVTGIGSQGIKPYQKGKPGYEGYLNERSLYLAELLKDGGYHTYIAGKWHLGSEDNQSPVYRGYERSYVLLPGVANHFGNREASPLINNKGPFREDGVLVTPPENYYSTNFFTDKLISYIDSNLGDGKPFFAFAAFTSPHWPMQAPDDFIDRYKGRYDVGYDVIKEARIARQKELGIIPADLVTYPGVPASANYPTWDQLTEDQKKFEARRMEIYAAMVENLDYNIGRLITHLKEKGEYDKTLIIFHSDNGAESNKGNLNNGYNNSLENIGRYGSYIYVGPRWAEVSAAPHRQWKTYSTEGGHHVPTIVRLPGQTEKKPPITALTGIQDWLPTFLDFGGIPNPGSNYKGREVNPTTGFSLKPLLEDKVSWVRSPSTVLANEHGNRRFVRKGNWKIVYFEPPFGKGDWELFHLYTRGSSGEFKNAPNGPVAGHPAHAGYDDLAELNDLSAENPDKRQELIDEWDTYVQQFGVVLPPPPPTL